MRSQSPIAVVTGANRGLGLATSAELARKGYRVLMLGRGMEAIRAVADELIAEGLDVVPVTCDVTDDEQVAMLEDRLAHHEGPVDILVNNAGVLPESGGGEDPSRVSALSASPDLIASTFNINTLGALRVSQAVIPHMRNGGCIVNVSSGMGQLSEMNGHYAAYRLSKTAMNALTRILAEELADRSIRVNSVCPGWVKTDMGGENATRDIGEGIAGIVWAATLPPDGPSGGFFRDGERIDW